MHNTRLMRTIRNIFLLSLFIILISCSHKTSAPSYGWKTNLTVKSSIEFSNQKVILEIGNYHFYFSKKDIVNQMINSKNYDLTFEPFHYQMDFVKKYLMNENVLRLNKSKSRIQMENKELDLDLSSNILFSLDELVKNGMFYLEKDGTEIMILNYKFWNPQLQGEIYSLWIDGTKEINKVHFGNVD